MVKPVSDMLSTFARKRPHAQEDGETNPTVKKRKTDGPDETQSGTSTSEVQVAQIATEIQSADSVTSDTQQPEEPHCRRDAVAAESRSTSNRELNERLDAILKQLTEMNLTTNKLFVAHKPENTMKLQP